VSGFPVEPLAAMSRSLVLPLQPLPVSRPWGGRRAAQRFGWTPPATAGVAPAAAVGEWWLASCQPGAASPLVEPARASGAADLPAFLAGPGQALGLPEAAAFPLLVKFLDCEQTLSLQVHPDDACARRQGLPRGKSECWHVLHAEPGAAVWLGTAPGVDAARLLERVAAGASDDEIRALLRRVELLPGDTLVVPAGSVHAVGAGLLLYEIQQNSDTTWRIHDWGRGRPVQLDRAREACLDRTPEAPVRKEPLPDRWTPLARTPTFALRRARLAGGLDVAPDGPFAILTVLDGHGTLRAGEATLPLRPGATALLVGPARLAGAGLDLLCTDAPR
jgi:mannose-6-phosphate isomerase